MFNNQGRILITNVPNGMWEERGRVNLHAHNPNPQAPEHLSMVNNLTNDNSKKKIVHDGTNLTCITQPEWKNLRSRVIMLAEPIVDACASVGQVQLGLGRGGLVRQHGCPNSVLQPAIEEAGSTA